jgi:hypothetical protein
LRPGGSLTSAGEKDIELKNDESKVEHIVSQVEEEAAQGKSQPIPTDATTVD